MKTRIFSATTLLCLTCLAARAQVTAEAIMGSCPPFPSQQEIVSYMMRPYSPGASTAAVDNFLKMLENAIDQANSAVEKQAKATGPEHQANEALRNADQSVQRDLGISIDQAQNMSQAELEALGHKKADDMLKKMGIKKSARQLENEGMSEAEEQQLAESMARQMTGMSMKELEALSKMSEKEQMEYAQKKGLAGKMAAKASKAGSSAAGTLDDAPIESIISYEYSDRWYDNYRKLEEMENFAVVQAFRKKLGERWVSGGYRGRIEVLEVELARYKVGDPGEAIVYGKMNVVREEFCRESVKEWYPRVMQKLSILKQIMQEDKMADTHATKAGRVGVTAIATAVRYLETARELVDAPSPGELTDYDYYR